LFPLSRSVPHLDNGFVPIRFDAMADDNDAERNYPATPRRLEQARERGQVARSRELATAVVALTAALTLWQLGPALLRQCLRLMHAGLSLDRQAAFDTDRMLQGLHAGSSTMLNDLLPVFGLLLGATIVAPLLLSGWVFSLTALFPDIARLNPARGLKNLLSTHSLAELAKAIAKCVLLGGIGAWTIVHLWGQMQGLALQGPASAVGQLGSVLGSAFLALVGGLTAIAFIDVPHQLWRYHKGLRMTREEVRQEQREMEGDPQLKARIRSQQRAMANKKMMAAVPKANVIVTNPTHYAVALEYRDDGMRAPRVVAKGMNLVAHRIREIGKEHKVPVLEAPPLARALYRHAEIGSEIPQALYTVVAQVLAYVYQVQRFRTRGGAAPAAPTAFDVPATLDPMGAIA
jgi:flagellar biosynthesis protein FlhB